MIIKFALYRLEQIDIVTDVSQYSNNEIDASSRWRTVLEHIKDYDSEEEAIKGYEKSMGCMETYGHDFTILKVYRTEDPYNETEGEVK